MAQPVSALALPEDGVEDMITLDNLSEDTMLQNLHRRYEKNKIYTYTGTILISVNPFKSLPIYTSSVLQRYIGKRIGLEPPHIFAVADEAYRNLREREQNQSIIISGESGSGKTEATKLILQYLATMTNKHSEVEQAILQSSPVLEAFGNAKTVRNNNSSRFGKLIEVNFDTGGAISGARITQYLLEKSRIVTQAATERNYHIFYQLCAGAADEEKVKWKLGKAEDYRYLNQSGCVAIPGVDDDESFQKTRTAMRFLGVTSDTLFAILSAVLHIGNIEFVDVNEKAKLKNEEEVLLVASLLQVDEKKLMYALTNRTLKIGGTETVVPLKLDQALDTRDALAKALYSKLFEWLVAHINKVIQKPNAKLFIGVLDIFGFENFKVNSFEQLCINFTNEKLQLHFNEHIFRLEQEEYAREKITWTKVDFKDNQECIDLIERNQAPLGVLALLDEECRFPKASDTTFLEKISQTHIKHKYFDRPKTSKSSFIVKHYAGNVSYEVKDFLEKNRDTLQVDLLNCLMTAKLDLVKTLMRAAAEAAATPEDKSQAGKRAPTVGGNFKNQLLALMTTLSATHAHYVRCIKPNALQAADNFDTDLVLAQLRYAGMLETVRIRRCGYPIRFQFGEFFKRYFLLAQGKDSFKPGKDARPNCERLLERLKLDREHVQAGQTKMFLRDYQYAAMEDKRNALLTKYAVRLQTWYRSRIARRWYLEQKRAAIVMQKYIRRYLALNRFVLMYIASVSLQKVVRAFSVRKAYKVKLVEWREKKRKEEEERKRLEEIRKKEEAEKKRLEEEQKKKEEEERKRLEEIKKKEEEERARLEEERRRKEEADEDFRRKREEAERQRALEEKRKKEDEERKRMNAEQLRIAEEKRKKEEEEERQRKIRDEEERARIVEEKRQMEEARKALEEERRKMEEERKAAQEALLKQMEEERKRLEEERRKRDEDDKRRKEEEEKERERKKKEDEEAREARERAPSMANRPKSFLGSGRDRGPSVTSALPNSPQSRVAEDNPLVTHVASMSIQKQLLEAQRVNEKKWKPFQLANGIAEPAALLADELANEFNFYAYAQKNFRQPEANQGGGGGWFGFGKKKAMSIGELSVFSKSQVDTSLLPIAAHYAVLATEIYNNIFLRHVLAPANEPVQYVTLQKAVREGVLKPELRDELYCQVIRLCNAVPAEFLARTWELVALVCGAFLPAPDLMKHVAGHLIGQRKNAGNKEVSAWAAYCLRRLERSALMGSRGKKLYRVQAPSVAEINAVRARGAVQVAVHTLDEEKYELEIDSATSANECLGLLSEKVGLSDASFWAVYEIFVPVVHASVPGVPAQPTKLERLERSLFIDEYVCDALAKAEFAKNYTFQLVFKRKVFLFPQLLPDDQRELELLYYQTADDLLEGRLPVAEKEALRLAAYRLKYEEHFVKIESLIPRPMWKKRSEAEWKKLLIKEEVQVSSKSEAMHYFLTNASCLQFFGAALFAVENTSDKSLPREFDLMVNVEGVHFVRLNDGTPEARKVFASYFYADVKIDYTAASVTVVYAEKSGKAKSLELGSKRGSEVHSIYRDYVYWLQAQSEWAKATQDYIVDDASLLSFHTGDVIKVTDKSNPEWYTGERQGQTGMFPSSSVILLLRAPPEAGPEGRAGRRRALTAKSDGAEPNLRASGGLNQSAENAGGGGEVRRRTGTVARDRTTTNDEGTTSASGSAIGGRERSGSMGRARSGSSAAGGGRSRALSRAEVLPPKFVKHDTAKWATHQADVGNTRLEVFAQAYFKGAAAISGAQRGRVNIGRRSETVDASHFVPLVSFTREPIKDCMLPIDSALVKAAIENFRCIMRLMDDLPRTRQDWEEMQALMASGLEHGSANPELNQMTLVEEIFMQILRQINNNPRLESQRRGFELLCVASGTLVPNNLVFKVLVGFLTELSTAPLGQDEVIGDIIKDCMDRLVYLRESEAERHLPPSTQEIQAVQVGGQLQQIVYFSDGRSKTLDVECVTTVKDFIDQLGEPRRFRGYAMFEVLVAAGLYMENPLKSEELIVDVLSRWERFVPPVRVEGELVFQLIWKKHIFLKSDPDETHPTALNLLYHQMVSSVVTLQIPTTEEEAIYLAGVQLKHDFDVGDDAKGIIEEHLDSYLPSQYHRLPPQRATLGADGQPMVGRGSPQLSRIMHVYTETPVLPKADLQRLYLTRVKQLPLYGCSTFNVQYMVERRMRPCLLALSEDHLQLWEVGPNQKAPVKRLEYADIASWGPKQGTLNITSGDLFCPAVDIIETNESFEIAEVIRAYKTAKAEAQLYAQRGELHYN